ncbi:MAG TPA: CoA transferase [Polyangiales bacterium]|nr:CoA transferase [Polyangiales bacterium]
MDAHDFEAVVQRAAAEAWRSMRGAPEHLNRLQLRDASNALPSFYEVAAFASACVGVANLALAEWSERPGPVSIDARHAALAFQCERWLTAIDWQLPAVWDPLAGDYRAADGFLRLHTNYAHHRRAVLQVLDVAPERDAVARALTTRAAEDVERDVVAVGGCAAVMRSAAAWANHPAGAAVAREPLLACEAVGGERRRSSRLQPERPLAGIRVLDLTRVIAGPVATRFLAAYGADVLRLDPPGFEEVPALLPETTAGKRCAALDLRAAPDRERFAALVAPADVLVCGLRSEALESLGFTHTSLREDNPGLIIARLDAYGWTGPWRGRRGFDSLVQMSCGIAQHGMQVSGADKPVPLPAQALDHGSGYLLAAAIIRALMQRASGGRANDIRLSLARTAAFLAALGVSDTLTGQKLTAAERAPFLEEADSAWGRIQRVRCPGGLHGVTPHWTHPAAPLGTAAAAWL